MIRENNFLRKYEHKDKAYKISVRIKKKKLSLIEKQVHTQERKKERKRERETERKKETILHYRTFLCNFITINAPLLRMHVFNS